MSQSKTPLRYPGGKQKLTPFILEILEANSLTGGHYVEPYCGGSGVAIDLLISRKVNSIHLNDSSYAIYAFWNSVLTETETFCRKIKSASLTVEEWDKQKYIMRNPSEFTEFEVGFSTFFLNRCNRSGVLTGGMIGGRAQNGIWKLDARFSRNDLINRIETIALHASGITLSNMDAEKFLKKYQRKMPKNTLIYFDPPYFEKASGLYLNFYKDEDHARLSEVIQSSVSKKWVLSYDNATEITRLYNQRRNFTYDLQYNAATVYKGKEVFIFCDDMIIPNNSKLNYINVGLESLAV